MESQNLGCNVILSYFFSLEALQSCGASGTFHMKSLSIAYPPIFLKDGDEVKLSIDILGEQKQKIKQNK